MRTVSILFQVTLQLHIELSLATKNSQKSLKIQLYDHDTKYHISIVLNKNPITPLYSKSGDTGTTTLSDQSVVKKNDPRVIAIADIEQTNATLGITLCEPST